jgi:hypothetical protein
MTTKYSQDSAKWWRHSDYEIRDGYIIPAPGARLTGYNPLIEYGATDGISQARERDGRLGRRAYTHLLDVARTLSRYVDGPFINFVDVEPTAYECDAILEFTKQHGLLGVLHNDFLQIADHGSGSGGKRALVRLGGSWSIDPRNVLNADTAVDCVRCFSGTGLDRFSFADLKKKFFPTGMPAPLPSPQTLDFFTAYVEPVREFALHACWFKMAIESLTGFERDPSELNRYLAGISTELRFRDGQLVEDRTYASLLSICADWFKRDHMAGLRLGSCEACGQIFVSNYERTRFCSQNCRWKDGKRRQRAQRKMHAGKTSQ